PGRGSSGQPRVTIVPRALRSGYSTGFFRCSSQRYDVNGSPPMLMSTRFADSFGVMLTRLSVRPCWPDNDEAANAHMAAIKILRNADFGVGIAIGIFLVAMMRLLSAAAP